MAKAPGSNHEPHKGQYTFKWIIAKVTGDNEQSSVEIIANAAELPVRVGMAYDLIDARMFQQNQRYQDFLEVSKDLPPEVKMKVNQCIDVAFGRGTVDDLTKAKHTEAEREAARAEKANGESVQNTQS